MKITVNQNLLEDGVGALAGDFLEIKPGGEQTWSFRKS